MKSSSNSFQQATKLNIPLPATASAEFRLDISVIQCLYTSYGI